MSFTRYKNLLDREPDITLARVGERLKAGRVQVLAWAARHVSEDAVRNPGSRSRGVDPSHRIVAESRKEPDPGAIPSDPPLGSASHGR